MNRKEFEELIDIGIRREKEAYEFYQFASSRVDNKAIRQIFAELAKDELGHRDILEKFKKDPKLPEKVVAPDIDYFLAEEVELPELSEKMKPADALALAMKKEQQAVQFYRRLAEKSSDESMKDLCLHMADMELNHKQKLENAYTDVAFVEAF